jgi:hypothetical protein
MPTDAHITLCGRYNRILCARAGVIATRDVQVQGAAGNLRNAMAGPTVAPTVADDEASMQNKENRVYFIHNEHVLQIQLV